MDFPNLSSPQPNNSLRQRRLSQGWTQQEVADKLFALFEEEGDAGKGINADTVGRWERGLATPSLKYRAKICVLFQANDAELGFQTTISPQASTLVVSPSQIVDVPFGTGDMLDVAESLVNLAWEAWFSSRPREAAKEIQRILPNLEKLSYTLFVSVFYQLRAKELVVRSHGLLGTIAMDRRHFDQALLHYTQAHKLGEEGKDTRSTALYLTLIGEVLRRQKQTQKALLYMEQAREITAHESSGTRGHILQLLAYTYGETGQEKAFQETICEVTDLLVYSGEGRDIEKKEFVPFEVYEIRGKIHRDLGEPLHALPFFDLAEQSLSQTALVTPRWSALLEISRAQVFCDAGDLDRGIDLACKGFLMAVQCQSPHQMNRVRKLLKSLESGPFREHSKIQQLKELLVETYMRIDQGTF